MAAEGAATLEGRLARVMAMVDRSPDPLRHPLGITFRPIESERHLASWERLAALASRAAIHDGLVLYVHIPFCARVCGYCLLASRRAEGRERMRRYVAALEREIELYAPRVERMQVRTIHVGGGTPTLLRADELDRLLGTIRARFRLSPDVEIGVEAHPTTTTRDKADVLAQHGVQRLSLGVETFTPAALEAVQRGDQTEDRVQSAVRAARDAGIAQVNLDLLAGLPRETVASFAGSVRRALALEPDSMSVNRYLAESSPLAAYGYVPDAAEDARTSEMLLEADRVVRQVRPPSLPREPLERAGFGTQYVWDRTGLARAYFQADMIGPASVLTLGHGVLGHVHGGTFYTSGASLDRWMDILLAGGAPPVRARVLGMRFERAFHFTDRASRGAFDPLEYRRVFGHDVETAFGPELALLESRGLLVQGSSRRWRKPASLAFQAVHLLAFLASADGADALGAGAGALGPEAGALGPEADALGAEADALGAEALGGPEPATLAALETSPRARVEVDDVGAAIERIRALPRQPAGVLELGLARELRADEAGALRDAAERSGWRIEIDRRDAGAVLRQYGAIGAEVPPSVLWCRIAMAAARAAREHEPLALVR